MTYDDDIALLAEDIRRYSSRDARIDEALTQLLRLYRAEVDALAFEAKELEAAVVRQTSRLEAAHIHETASRKQWGTWNESAQR